jgi:uncharacterized RDD family membrane protein YckC
MIIRVGNNKNLSKRYFANFFDYIILTVVFAICVILFGETQESVYYLRGSKALIIPFIWFLYFPLCECALGQTIGKKAFNLYVVDLKGETPTIVQAFLRRMLDPVEIILLGVPGMLAINHSKKNQRIGDMIAGTTVVATAAVCRFCNVELELMPKEVINDVFRCPKCNEVN